MEEYVNMRKSEEENPLISSHGKCWYIALW